MSYAWAEAYPELYKVCVLFDRTEISSPIKWAYAPLPTYLQKGPQCGLVALAMLIGNTEESSVNTIYEYARKQKFTCNGEIFSVDYMYSLTKQFMKDADVNVYADHLDCDEIKNFLLSGGKMLVPYDTNKDNTPGLKNGHTAHWCAISGAIETEDDFFVVARHGKVVNVAVWKLCDLAESNRQLNEFSPDKKNQNVPYQLPEGGINGACGLSGRCVLISD